MDLILEPILTAFIIVGLLVLAFFLLSFKYKPLESYRNKVIELSLWVWGILSAILIFTRLSKKAGEGTGLDIEKKLGEDLDDNREEFHDKIENPDSPDDLSDRGRDLADRLRRR